MVKKGYKKTEIGIIPEDWNVKSFLEVGTYFKGSGISMRDVVYSGYPCIMYGDIYVKFDTHFSKCDYQISAQTASRSTRAQHGDLFLTASGETAEEIGKCVSYQGKDDIFIGGDIIAIRPSIEYNSLFLAYVQNSALLINQKASYAQGCSVVHISSDNIKKLTFASPSKLSEQEAIADALSDIDTLIANLKKMIEKKKAVKQGTMQLLLTGEKRLPGFNGDWDHVSLGDRATILRGGSPRPINAFLTTSLQGINWIKIGDVKPNAKYIDSTEERIVPGGALRSRSVSVGDFILSNSMSYGRPYILRIDGCIHDGWLVIQNYQADFDREFLFYILGAEGITTQYDKMAAGSSVQNLNKEKVSKLIVPCPDKKEQAAIAIILSDMDSEITKLEEKLLKYRYIKIGMMQTLLTGKIRLSQQDAPAVIVTPIKATDQLIPETKGHNQLFDDAVAIAAIVNAFYSDKYPLGRKKVQKLLYLLRRRQDASTAVFKKKAAGPYADEVRYKGGEPIAIRNNYVTVNNSKQGSMFAKGKDIGKALDYVAKWAMQTELDWLIEQFLHTKVDTLELLATIDMAMCELENSGVKVSVDSVKKLIASDKEWKAKLNKTCFSDADIGWAITECLGLFDSTGR